MTPEEKEQLASERWTKALAIIDVVLALFVILLLTAEKYFGTVD